MHLPVQECGSLALTSIFLNGTPPQQCGGLALTSVFLNGAPSLLFWRQALLLNLEPAILDSLDNHLAPGFSLLSPVGFRITNGLSCFYVGSGDPNSPVLSFAQQAISPGCLLDFLIHICYTEHETML